MHNHITAIKTALTSYGFNNYGYHIEGKELRWRDPHGDIHKLVTICDAVRGLSVNLAIDYYMPRLIINTITNRYHINYDGWVRFDNDLPDNLCDEY